jgi:hypothetical protein
MAAEEIHRFLNSKLCKLSLRVSPVKSRSACHLDYPRMNSQKNFQEKKNCLNMLSKYACRASLRATKPEGIEGLKSPLI